MKQKIIEFAKQPIIYILIFCIGIQILIYKTIPDAVVMYDTTSYTTEYNGDIFKGEVDKARTPVYPYLIKIIGAIGGQENLYSNIVIFQKLLFVITIILFYACLKKVTKNRIIICVLTIIFGICPYIIFWNVLILTEALSLFEIVLLSLITLTYLNKPNMKSAIAMRDSCSINDFNKAVIYLFITNIYTILDFKVFSK